MLALIVLGRIQMKKFDVYLQPLIDEFKKLGEGINMMYQDPFQWIIILHCMAYLCTWHMIVED